MKSFMELPPTTLLSPVPAVLVSVCGTDPWDRPNLLTIAWAGTVNSDPPMVSISVQKKRFSHHLIVASGEFVVNLADRSMARAVDFCGVKSGREVDKFAACGLMPAPASGMIHAPAVVDSPAYLACRVRHTLELGSHDMFVGEVVGVGVREDLVDAQGGVHLERSGLICYTHGVYQAAGEVLGFFGYSVARPDVLARRMAAFRN